MHPCTGVLPAAYGEKNDDLTSPLECPVESGQSHRSGHLTGHTGTAGDLAGRQLRHIVDDMGAYIIVPEVCTVGRLVRDS